MLISHAVNFILQFYGQGEKYSEALDYLNMIFTAVFGVEFILKFAAFRVKVMVSHILHPSLTYT